MLMSNNANPTLSNRTGMTFLRRITSFRESILLIVIAVVFLIMALTSEFFLTQQTMLNLLMSLTVEGIIAIGMVILLVSGGLDLSAGANMAFTGVFTGLLLESGVPLIPAICMGLLAGLGIGLFNGFLIAIIGLNPLITTLGTQMTFSGLMMMITKGKAVLMPVEFQAIGKGTLLGVQYPVWILIVLVVVFDLLLRRSRVFRTSYYIGSNENAAKFNGINVKKVKLINYVLAGLFAGLTGIVLAARLTTASVTVGGDTALRTITACIIGGATLNGGEGTILGGFLGVVFIQIISSSLNMMSVDVYLKTFVTGLILIAAITLDVLNEKRKTAKATALTDMRM